MPSPSGRSTSPRASCSPSSTARRSSARLRGRRPFGLGPREWWRRPWPRASSTGARVRRDRCAVPRRSASHPGAARRPLQPAPGAGRQRLRRHPGDRAAARPPHDLRPRGPPPVASPSAARRSAPRRPLCLDGLRDLRPAFDEFLALDAGGPLTRQALRRRAVDVALLFTHRPRDRRHGRARRAGRRPRAAAGRERHAARAPSRVERFGRRLVDRDRRGVRAARHRRPAELNPAWRPRAVARRPDRATAWLEGEGLHDDRRRRHRRRCTAGRRRPTGAAPPLPRSIGTAGLGWLVAAVVLVADASLAFTRPASRAVDRADAAVLRAVADLRTAWLTDVMRRSPASGRAGR